MGFRAQGSGFKASWDVGFRPQSLECKIQSLGFNRLGLGYRTFGFCGLKFKI